MVENARKTHLLREDEGQTIPHTRTFIQKLRRSRREDQFPKPRTLLIRERKNPILTTTDLLNTRRGDLGSLAKNHLTSKQEGTIPKPKNILTLQEIQTSTIKNLTTEEVDEGKLSIFMSKDFHINKGEGPVPSERNLIIEEDSTPKPNDLISIEKDVMLTPNALTNKQKDSSLTLKSDNLTTYQRNPTSIAKDLNTKEFNATSELKDLPQLTRSARMSSSPPQSRYSPKALRMLMGLIRAEAAGDVVASPEDGERIYDRETERKESYIDFVDREINHSNGIKEDKVSVKNIDPEVGKRTDHQEINIGESIDSNTGLNLEMTHMRTEWDRTVQEGNVYEKERKEEAGQRRVGEEIHEHDKQNNMNKRQTTRIPEIIQLYDAGDIRALKYSESKFDEFESESENKKSDYYIARDGQKTNESTNSFQNSSDVNHRNDEGTKVYHFAKSETTESKVQMPFPLNDTLNPTPKEMRFVSHVAGEVETKSGTLKACEGKNKTLCDLESSHVISESQVPETFTTIQDKSPKAMRQVSVDPRSFYVSSVREGKEEFGTPPTSISFEDKNQSPHFPRSFHLSHTSSPQEISRTFQVERQNEELREFNNFQESSGSLVPEEFMVYQPYSLENKDQDLREAKSVRVIPQADMDSQSSDLENKKYTGFRSLWPNKNISPISSRNNNYYVNNTRPTTTTSSNWTTRNKSMGSGRTHDNISYTSYSHVLNKNAASSPMIKGEWQTRMEDKKLPGVENDEESRHYLDIQSHRTETSLHPWPPRLPRNTEGVLEAREAQMITQHPPFEVQLGFSLPVNQTTSLKLINILRFNASLPTLLDPSRPEIIVDLETGVGPAYANDSQGFSLDLFSSDFSELEQDDATKEPDIGSSNSSDETRVNSEKIAEAQTTETMLANKGKNTTSEANSENQVLPFDNYSHMMTTAVPENEAQVSTSRTQEDANSKRVTNREENTEFMFDAATELADLLGIPVSELQRLLIRNPGKNPVTMRNPSKGLVAERKSTMISLLNQDPPQPLLKQQTGVNQQRRRPFMPSNGLRAPPQQNRRRMHPSNNNNNNNNNPQSVDQQEGNGRNQMQKQSQINQNAMLEARGFSMDPSQIPHLPIVPEPKLWSIFYRPQDIALFREDFPTGREYNDEVDTTYSLSGREAEAIRRMLLADGKMEYMRRMLGMETNNTQINGNEEDDMMSRMGKMQITSDISRERSKGDTEVKEENPQSDTNSRDKSQGDLSAIGDRSEDMQVKRAHVKDNMQAIVDLLRYLQLIRRYRVGDVNNETARVQFPGGDRDVGKNVSAKTETPNNSTQLLLDTMVLVENEGKKGKKEGCKQEPEDSTQEDVKANDEDGDRREKLHKIAELIRFLKAEKRKKFEEIDDGEDNTDRGGNEKEQNTSEDIMTDHPNITSSVNSDNGDQENNSPKNDTLSSVKDLMKTMEKSKFDLVVDFIMSLQKNNSDIPREGELNTTPDPINSSMGLAEEDMMKRRTPPMTKRSDQQMAATLDTMSSNVTSMLMQLENNRNNSNGEILDAIEELIIRVQSREINRIGEVPDENTDGTGTEAMIGGMSVEDWLQLVLERGNHLRGKTTKSKRTMRKVGENKEEERNGDEIMSNVGRLKEEIEEMKELETPQDTERGINRELELEKSRNDVDSCDDEDGGEKKKSDGQRESNDDRISKVEKQENGKREKGNGENDKRNEKQQKKEPDEKMDGNGEGNQESEKSDGSKDEPNESQSNGDGEEKDTDDEGEEDVNKDKEDEKPQGTNNTDEGKNQNGYGGERHRYEWRNGNRHNDRGRRERFRGRPPTPQRFGNFEGRRPFGSWLGDPIAVVQAPDLSPGRPSPPGNPPTPPRRPGTSFQNPTRPTKDSQALFRGPNSFNGHNNNPIRNIVSSPRDPLTSVRRPDPSFRGQVVSTRRPDTSFRGQFPSTRRPDASFTGSFVSTRRPGPVASNENVVAPLRNTFTSNREPGTHFRGPHASVGNPVESGGGSSEVIHSPQFGPPKNPISSFQRPFQPTRFHNRPNNEHIIPPGRPSLPGTPQISQIGPDEGTSSYATVPGKPIRFDRFNAASHESNERPETRPSRSPVDSSEIPDTLFRSPVPQTERPLSFFQNPLKFFKMPLLFGMSSEPNEAPITSYVTKSPTEEIHHRPQGLFSWAI
ncbi:hypothetical protein Pmani_020542 [Petrolisthes manimaculis]|nr:hypothetical protein Pmani_020542 [Petrolisthes manimaculis]